jgi:hypothetical protein
MDCRDCEAFLQLGIDAFEWIMRADRVLRSAAATGEFNYSKTVDKGFRILCEDWLRPCDFAIKWIAKHAELGYEVENRTRFLTCYEEMVAIVESGDENGRELAAAMRELRDQAVNEHLNGQTAEFISGEESDH